MKEVEQSHLNLPKRIHEPQGSLNNTLFDGEITYVIEAPRVWWENDYILTNPRRAMTDIFTIKDI